MNAPAPSTNQPPDALWSKLLGGGAAVAGTLVLAGSTLGVARLQSQLPAGVLLLAVGWWLLRKAAAHGRAAELLARERSALEEARAALAAETAGRQRVEEELRAAHQTLQLFSEHTPMAVIEWDTKFRVTRWNPAARTIFGFNRDEAVGQHASFIVPEAFRPQVDKVWQGLLQQTGGERSSNENVCKDGRTIVCEWYNTPLIDDRGAFTGAASVVMDVTERKHAEDTRRESEERLRAAIAASGTGTFRWDIRSNELSWDEALDALFGLPRGKTVRSLENFIATVHPDDRPGVSARCERCARDGADFAMEFRVVWPDGSEHWLDDQGKTFFDDAGQPLYMAGACVDITERIKAEAQIRQLNASLERRVEERTRELQAANVALHESEERVRLATEAADIGVWAWDLKTNELNWDARMFALYGLPAHPEGRAVYGDWRARVLPEDLAAQEARLQETVATCGHSHREFRIVRADDQTVRFIQAAETVVVGADGKAARVVGINRDITARKLSETRISRLNADLLSRAAELETANKELEGFSYSVSHDLRAPLRAVDGFARMLTEDYAERLDEDGRRMLGVIRGESQRMARLIDDLLAFSRLGRQTLEPQEIDMHGLARGVFDELAALEPGRELRLALAPLPPVRGSEAMLRQVWVNLLSNALKFTSGCAVAQIEIGTRDDADGGVVYFVKDNGAGFDMRYADKLFGVFQRLHTQEEFTGTGVGLALVQRIVARHGGRIWAEAEVGRGAAFFFTIPKRQP